MSDGFGDRLRALREKAGQTQPQVAAATGTNTTTISRWERDVGMPHAEQLVALAKHFGVTSDYLLFGTTHEDPVGTAAFHEFLATDYGRIAQKNGWLDALKSMRYPFPPTAEVYIDLVLALQRAQRSKQRKE